MSNDSLSLVLFHGGPLDRFLARLGLGGCSGRQIKRRILFWVAIIWLPPFLLGTLASFFSTETLLVDIFNDLSFHVRCLVAMPILIASQCYVQFGIANVISMFMERRMIRPDKEASLIELCRQLNNFQKSGFIEALLLLLSFLFVAKRFYLDLPLQTSSWKTSDSLLYIWAASWNQWVGLTVYFFILLRWVLRFLLWGFFLIRMATLKPVIRGLHPDQMGGLFFLVRKHVRFGLVLTATSSLIGANIATSVIHGGVKVDTFLLPLIFYLVIAETLLLVPLLAYTPLLILAKREGLFRYGTLGSRYVELFHQKWFVNKKEMEESPLGTPDIQSLCDLDGSYDHLRGMYIVLLNRRILLSLAVLTVMPLLPLLLFKVRLTELISLIVNHFI